MITHSIRRRLVIGSAAITARDGVCVDVQCRGSAGVAEALRDGGDGHAGGEHLGGHEVA